MPPFLRQDLSNEYPDLAMVVAQIQGDFRRVFDTWGRRGCWLRPALCDRLSRSGVPFLDQDAEMAAPLLWGYLNRSKRKRALNKNGLGWYAARLAPHFATVSQGVAAINRTKKQLLKRAATDTPMIVGATPLDPDQQCIRVQAGYTLQPSLDICSARQGSMSSSFYEDASFKGNAILRHLAPFESVRMSWVHTDGPFALPRRETVVRLATLLRVGAQLAAPFEDCAFVQCEPGAPPVIQGFRREVIPCAPAMEDELRLAADAWFAETPQFCKLELWLALPILSAHDRADLYARLVAAPAG